MKKIINIPETMSSDMALLSKEFGFSSDTEFIRNAVRDKIIELKKLLFMQISTRIGKSLKAKGVTEIDLLRDFEKWRKSQSS